MLRLDSLSCGYGDMTAVQELTLDIPDGEITVMLGANGAGKSSTIMCIAGHVNIIGGRITYNEKEITHATPMARIKAGIAVVPEGRRLFPSLTVKENLIVGGYSQPNENSRDSIDRVLNLFPRLGDRLKQLAGSLSGGEQQMLSIGRALMSSPKLLLIDELSLGLMPKIIDLCYEAITELKKNGLTILIVEQSTQRALEVADRVCVLESGKEVWQDTAARARDNAALIDTLLGLN
ncbi:Branched-chain amino acid transport ATP-binding protein LivF (TC 3.A.1.4.1) [Olavius sp. associated proteobacterium Delta 1]|nr:Branched-chain amino acid transport ATP-binding protein LivF (TC 3.A.1.4.1) [Olavius sp. associated proteobacterium Delta 1]